MSVRVLLITPPFTQLNTPYPATAYLKGFLNTLNISSFQMDLGIEVILQLFSTKGLQHVFDQIDAAQFSTDENVQRIITLQESYIETIDGVIEFLQGKNPMMAHRICQRGYLPEAFRFTQIDDLQFAFGSMGIQDKAKHVATLYLEDLADLMRDTLDPFFGFSRYAERLGRSAHTFDDLYEALQKEPTLIDRIGFDILKKHIETTSPQLVALSVPFPGNLYSALRCGQWIKQHYPHIRIAMGGGFPNTELRVLQETRVFEFVDFITLDDGETPILNLLEHLEGKRDVFLLKRTFALAENQVKYFNGSLQADYKQHQIGTPDYSDLLLDQYISAIEVANPMHRLWSDGVWNKLTMAHGCYWGKCTFCDISLDYIKNYEPLTATLLCDRIETLIAQNKNRGFHFVDEAAPPGLMKALAIEIIKRKLVITWWTNIRFEKSFTEDLCYLLKASGCIAVSGGLEVASDRLLALIDKGITVAQVAQVTHAFTKAGIMVHAYLMYGFPTQTAQETIDSLEMVRQMFKLGILQSAFWHRFALTAHSPVGLHPEQYKVKILQQAPGTFANNDVDFEDLQGTHHEHYGFGLQKSLFNYMHQIGLDESLQKWFEVKVPKTSIETDYIETCLQEVPAPACSGNRKVYWLGTRPRIEWVTKSKKGMSWKQAYVHVEGNQKKTLLKISEVQGHWLMSIWPLIDIHTTDGQSLELLAKSYEEADMEEDFELFWYNKIRKHLLDFGLLVL